MTEGEISNLKGHLDQVIAMARLIRKNVTKQSVWETKNDIRGLEGYVVNTLNSPVFH